MTEIGNSPSGSAKYEILRKVCFADLCGIRLTSRDLMRSQTASTMGDLGELLKSMNDEFLVRVSSKGQYIEGLHPIRSKHIVDRLHEFFPIDETILAVIRITKKSDVPMLFSHIPEFEIDKDCFDRIVELLWNEKDLSGYIDAIQGLFSGSVMKYYNENKMFFDDANLHGGLSLIAMEVCPFTHFSEFDVSLDTLNNMQETLPENKNIAYLCELRDRISPCNLHESYIYSFCSALYKKIQSYRFPEIDDPVSFISICEWLYSIDREFNLSSNLPLSDIWQRADEYPIKSIASTMYSAFCGNTIEYQRFVAGNLDRILRYLKHHTNSHKIYIESERNAIHVEYISRLGEVNNENNESVSRLKIICKSLPIFDFYCADAIKPKLNLLSSYSVPDNAHKEMPRRNIVIMFHQNLTTLWNKTILSNYEFDTVAEWIEYWLDIRNRICILADYACSCIQKVLTGKPLSNTARKFDKLLFELNQITICERRYPKEDRPFEERPILPKVKSDYFQSMNNFFRQFAGFIKRTDTEQRLALFNLKTAKSTLKEMQHGFSDIIYGTEYQQRHADFCIAEMQSTDLLLMTCSYYQSHYPNKYFSRYQIKDWYEKSRLDEMKIIENSLSQFQFGYAIHFPDKIYTIGILSHYPLIVENLDASSEQKLALLLFGCISFLDSPFDYLVVMFADENKQVKPGALKIPRRMIEKIKTSMESGCEIQNDNMSLPYPTDVTEQMLKCFHSEFILQPKNPVAHDLSPISEIAEELWIYSKLRELLVEPGDSNYLKASLEPVQQNIFKMLQLLSKCLSPDDIQQLSSMCEKVFAGISFNNDSFNMLIERLIISTNKIS